MQGQKLKKLDKYATKIEYKDFLNTYLIRGNDAKDY